MISQKVIMTFYYLVGAVLLVILIWLIGVFNSLIRRRNTVRNAASDIDVQTKRRYDLIPNLVEVAKGYAAHESGVLERITETRTRAMATPIGAAKAAVENDLTAALKSLFAVSENYPQLRANENFLALQEQLSSIETDIQSARRYFNAAVRDYNTSLQVFPRNMVAGLLGFAPEIFFGATEDERTPVKVDL